MIFLFTRKSLSVSEPDLSDDESSPQLFSDEGISNSSSENNVDSTIKSEEEEDFEIPAFLRKQKF